MFSSPQDGILDDEELNKFQVKCFNAPLQPTELAGVKHVVGDRLSGVSHRVPQRKICHICVSATFNTGYMCQ